MENLLAKDEDERDTNRTPSGKKTVNRMQVDSAAYPNPRPHSFLFGGGSGFATKQNSSVKGICAGVGDLAQCGSVL